jgi:hypothetical protein
MTDIIEELKKFPQVDNVITDDVYIAIKLKGNTIRYSVLRSIDNILDKYEYFLYSVSINTNHEQLQILGLR